MNAKKLTTATVWAVCLGLIAILLKLSLPGFLMIVGGFSALILDTWPNGMRAMKEPKGNYKSNEAHFEQKIVLLTVTIMLAMGLGITYILLNHLLSFQPNNIECDKFINLRWNLSAPGCAKHPGKTVIELCVFLSLIAVMWSLARRYMVREHWDDL